MEMGHADVTMALMMYGVGGIVGNVLNGLVMNFGPLADKHFALFIANNLVMLLVAGKGLGALWRALWSKIEKNTDKIAI